MSHAHASTDPDGVEGSQVETSVVGEVARVVLRGELDFSMLSQLDAALGGIALEGDQVVHLDLSLLEFADTAAVRRLAAFATAARRAGHDVETVGANRTIRRVAAVLHVDDDLGLT